MAREAPARIDDLVAFGAPFDRNADGTLALGREAAHSVRPHRACQGRPAPARKFRARLPDARTETPSITLLEGFHAVELAMEDGRVTGLFARHGIGRATRG